ncbi:hypothetical protein Syun_010234 [Stephania yunnanensis]|uniref:Gnk2-homologous domain-containing protein n=1 Tax=Stephania yunnanensis TaxID=152371 RepID=A0AAP0KH43_9MAGN
MLDCSIIPLHQCLTVPLLHYPIFTLTGHDQCSIRGEVWGGRNHLGIHQQLLLFSSFTTAKFIASPSGLTDAGYTCSTDNFTTNSPFTTNLNSLLASLQAKAPSTGLYKDSVGQNPYQLYGVLQCRGDLSSKDCASCAKNGAREALQSCTNSTWGNVWLQTCSLHYSTENLFGVLDRNATMITFDQVPDAEDVSLKGLELMDKLASSALTSL